MPKSKSRSKSSEKKKKSSKSKTTEEPIVDVVENEVPVVSPNPVEPVVDAPVEKKKSSKKTKTIETPEGGESVQDQTGEATKKRVRREVTRETFFESLDTMVAELDAEITSAKSETDKKKKTVNVKLLKNLIKKLRLMKNDANKVMKNKKPSNRPKNSSSGFMKPVQISKEMADFTGWNPEAPASRVDVTKFICNYIREKDLQNPSDRRNIRPNDELRNLLNLSEGEDQPPLTYYSLQKHIQHHFLPQKA